MYVDKMKEKGSLFSFRLELQDAYEAESVKIELRDPETGDPYYLEFRELSGDEYRELIKVESKDQLATLEGKLVDCILRHNMKNSDREPASVEDVVAAIRGYGSLFYHVLQEWQKSIPLLEKSAAQLRKSRGTRSEADE